MPCHVTLSLPCKYIGGKRERIGIIKFSCVQGEEFNSTLCENVVIGEKTQN
jgi:hypothetical protein